MQINKYSVKVFAVQPLLSGVGTESEEFAIPPRRQVRFFKFIWNISLANTMYART